MIDKSFSELMSYKYIQLAVALHPIIPSLKKKIEEKEFVVMDAKIFKDMYNSESTFRLVMFAHDIIVSSSKKSFIFRNRVLGKDKTPIGWGKTVRKLRKLMKDEIWKKNVEKYHKKNYEISREKIGRALFMHKDRFRKI